MSRSSPGRYALHEFARNIFWLEAYDGAGRPLQPTRPNPYEWDVSGHDGTVRIVYKVFGDRVDGTYLAVDRTHAHINMPAAFLFDLDHQDRSIRATFVRPANLDWQVATQLYATADPLTFTAPNLQYFMDSPVEFSRFLTTTFTVRRGAKAAAFRLVVHARASQAEVEELAKAVERLVREEAGVFGELPLFETGTYTFLLDFLADNDSDGMEHRNSTVITSGNAGTVATAEGRAEALDSIAHEFFHAWNVERIRPAGLEPFDFTTANITCCLWLAEGFTQYYGPLLLMRAGFRPPGVPIDPSGVINGSGRQVRSAVQMSEYATFADGAQFADPSDQSRSFISYYPFGAAIAMALDLSLREMSAGHLSLDDLMRLLSKRYGSPSAPPGLVARPYTLSDVRDAIADVAGNRAFAEEFVRKYVEGRDVADYSRLLSLAGYALRHHFPDRAWTGADVGQATDGVTLVGGAGSSTLVPFGTPAYAAGLEVEDVVRSIDGQPATVEAWHALSGKKPGDAVKLVVASRDGVAREMTMTLAADPTFELVDIGNAMTDAQRAFRNAWLGTKTN